MVVHHDRTVLCFDCSVVSFVDHSQNQLGLSQRHRRIEPSGVHLQGVQVFTVANVVVHPMRASDALVNEVVPIPKATSPTPRVVLIININIRDNVEVIKVGLVKYALGK